MPATLPTSTAASPGLMPLAASSFHFFRNFLLDGRGYRRAVQYTCHCFLSRPSW